MKKGEKPEFSAKWWKDSQPKGLKSAAKLESALKDYETARHKLESSGSGEDADDATAALKEIDIAAKAVIAEAKKAKNAPEMDFTVACLDKLDTKKEQDEVDGLVEDGMFSDPEVYHHYLITALKRLKTAGEMNFGFVLGKKAEQHRIALKKNKSGKALASMVANETGMRQMTWGTAKPDPDEGNGAMLLTLEGKQLAGLAKKGERMLKKFKPLPFTKIRLFVEGKEVQDLADPDDTDTDDEEATLDPAALARELAELIRRIQGVGDAALKGELARTATQANALLRSNNLPEAEAKLGELRTALENASAGTTGGNGTGNGGGASTVTYAKSRLAWIAARKKIESEIEKLRAEIVSTYQAEGIAGEIETSYRGRVAPVLEALDESLADKLDEATNATDATVRAGLVAEAKEIMQRYQTYLSSEPLIGDLDDNPFVPLAIRQTISATLGALEKAVH